MLPVPSHSPLRIYGVTHKTDPDATACLSDEAEDIAVFLWNRILSEHQLRVNGREYGWGSVTELQEIAIHLRSCREMDEVLYEYD